MKYESMRHGHKEGENLSGLGREQAREKALELIAEIRASAPGSVFFVVPSDVGRAQDTRGVIEDELRLLGGGDADIAYIDVNDAEGLRAAKGDFTKKYVVTGMPGQRKLGFKASPQAQAAYIDIRGELRDEDLTAKVWISRAAEVGAMQDELRAKVGEHVPMIKMHPERFGLTPEEAAIRHLRLFRQLEMLRQRYFDGHPATALQVNHSPHADFAFMALAGKELSLKAAEEMGGKFRDFMESAKIDVGMEEIRVDYRGSSFLNRSTLDDVIKTLEAQADERRKEWRGA